MKPRRTRVRRITEVMFNEVKKYLNKGYTHDDIAKLLGISSTPVDKIATSESYADYRKYIESRRIYQQERRQSQMPNDTEQETQAKKEYSDIQSLSFNLHRHNQLFERYLDLLEERN